MKSIVKTNFQFLNQTNVYKGKVRDVYRIADDMLVMIATDRISAFDTVLPVGIPYKGQVLNQIANDLQNPKIQSLGRFGLELFICGSKAMTRSKSAKMTTFLVPK